MSGITTLSDRGENGLFPDVDRQHLPSIDALRGIAALEVALVFHQHFMLRDYRSGPLDGLPIFTQIHAYGWIAVDLFFVISGFIFTHVYFANGRVEATAREFAIARFARLYPLHFATLLAAAIALSFKHPHPDTFTAWHFLLNLLMLQESGLNDGLSFNGPAWSISVEVYCYVAFYYLAKRFPRALIPMAWVISVTAFCLTTGKDQPTLDHIARGFCGFFAGILAYRYRSAPVWALLPLATVPFLFVGHVRFFSWGSVLAVTAFPAWVLLAPRIGLLATRPFLWVGERSYSLYLVHAPIYWLISFAFLGGRPVSHPWPMLALSSALILLTADLSYRYFETPARRAIRRWGERSKAHSNLPA